MPSRARGADGRVGARSTRRAVAFTSGVDTLLHVACSVTCTADVPATRSQRAISTGRIAVFRSTRGGGRPVATHPVSARNLFVFADSSSVAFPFCDVVGIAEQARLPPVAPLRHVMRHPGRGARSPIEYGVPTFKASRPRRAPASGYWPSSLRCSPWPCRPLGALPPTVATKPCAARDGRSPRLARYINDLGA